MYELSDAVECTITCSKCGRTEGGFGICEDQLVSVVEEDGWEAYPAGKVLCPTCQVKPVAFRRDGE